MPGGESGRSERRNRNTSGGGGGNRRSGRSDAGGSDGGRRGGTRSGSPNPTPGIRGAIGRRLSTVRLFNTRRAALLALVVCALALSVAVPLRTYLEQRSEVAVQLERQEKLREKVQRLEQRKAELNDPTQVEAEARLRLRYVMPGETPYIVQLPGDRGAGGIEQAPREHQQQQPWYTQLWSDVTGTR